MLVEFSTQVATDLNDYSPLMALLSASGVSALISEQEDGDSYINYFIQFDGDQSKDGAKGWQVEVQSWADTYDKSIAIADEVENAIGASVNRYEYVSALSLPSRAETNKTVIVTKQIFNIKQ